MTLALLRPVVEPREGLPPHEVVAGMPQLGRQGLSEQWLLRECGHRHWLMLADLFGLPQPEFRDREGHKLYATFTGLALSDARLDRVEEHDVLRFAGRIHRVSRTQFESVQQIAANGVPVARVAMVSAFLRRAVPGDNHSVLRALPSRALPGTTDTMPGEALAGLAHRFRHDRWEEHAGFRRTERRPASTLRITPCPHGDFNGAGFLYFASFQSFVDRCEWMMFGERSLDLVTAERDLFYYGNINPGDTLSIGLCGDRQDDSDRNGGGRTHWFEILRGSDGVRIADVFTRRFAGTAGKARRASGSAC